MKKLALIVCLIVCVCLASLSSVKAIKAETRIGISTPNFGLSIGGGYRPYCYHPYVIPVYPAYPVRYTVFADVDGPNGPETQAVASFPTYFGAVRFSRSLPLNYRNLRVEAQ